MLAAITKRSGQMLEVNSRPGEISCDHHTIGLLSN